MRIITYLSIMFALLSFDRQAVIVCAPEGELFVFNADSGEQFVNTIEQLQGSFGTSGEVYLDFTCGRKRGKKPKASAHSPITTQNNTSNVPFRDYSIPATEEEKQIIATIVNSLGNDDVKDINRNKDYLKKIGDQVQHVHPLRFLMCIFTDEKMKASIAALKSRTFGWIWKGFFDNGLKKSLEKESTSNNIRQEQIDDFAAQVGINSSLITPAIQNHQWSQFLNILIDNIPRNSNANKYNM